MVQDDEGGTRAAANATTIDADTEATVAAAGDGEIPFELPPAGYQLGSLIGKGGMGEVVAAHDQRIGREVAFKRMRKANVGGDALARFLREARIQARLDHPAIVPVYDLGKDEEGRPYFTMKRLAGKTLGEYLAAPDVPRQRLLRAFADVCLAVELAHQRGVVHRDLKPSNIMLGDFGEVYVLDWGVARVIARKRRQTGGLIADDIDSIGGDATVDGALLGTRYRLWLRTDHPAADQGACRRCRRARAGRRDDEGGSPCARREVTLSGRPGQPGHPGRGWLSPRPCGHDGRDRAVSRHVACSGARAARAPGRCTRPRDRRRDRRCDDLSYVLS